ncbi:MAG: helix-turn-helix transcriptional regulator, partial [Chryseobacterium sp.]|nr:helix-turn-helix transcriptional regulator [Chryseobacterium sp.]
LLLKLIFRFAVFLFHNYNTMKFKIEEIMQIKGFNNVKLADALGIQRGTVTNNLKKPSLDTLIKIAEVLEVKVSDLLDEGETNQEPIYKKDHKGNFVMIGYIKK